ERWPVAAAVPAPSRAWACGASSASSGPGPPACTPGACPRRRRRVRRTSRPSPARPRLARLLRTPGEQLQERVCFSHDLRRGLGPRQLAGELLVVPAQPLHLGLLGARPSPTPTWLARRPEAVLLVLLGI